jgi:hypothetical protein
MTTAHNATTTDATTGQFGAGDTRHAPNATKADPEAARMPIGPEKATSGDSGLSPLARNIAELLSPHIWASMRDLMSDCMGWATPHQRYTEAAGEIRAAVAELNHAMPGCVECEPAKRGASGHVERFRVDSVQWLAFKRLASGK